MSDSPPRTGAGGTAQRCLRGLPDAASVAKGVTTVEPAQFREAVAAMNAAGVRPEIELGPIRPPQRLAPFSYALGAEVKRDESTVLADGPGARGRRA